MGICSGKTSAVDDSALKSVKNVMHNLNLACSKYIFREIKAMTLSKYKSSQTLRSLRVISFQKIKVVSEIITLLARL